MTTSPSLISLRERNPNDVMFRPTTARENWPLNGGEGELHCELKWEQHATLRFCFSGPLRFPENCVPIVNNHSVKNMYHGFWKRWVFFKVSSRKGWFLIHLLSLTLGKVEAWPMAWRHFICCIYSFPRNQKHQGVLEVNLSVCLSTHLFIYPGSSGHVYWVNICSAPWQTLYRLNICLFYLENLSKGDALIQAELLVSFFICFYISTTLFPHPSPSPFHSSSLSFQKRIDLPWISVSHGIPSYSEIRYLLSS